MSKNRTGLGVRVVSDVVAHNKEVGMFGVKGRYKLEVVRDGVVVDKEEFDNLIVNQGLNYVRDVTFLDGTKAALWYLILINGSPTITATNTYATPGGWAEVTNYEEATREVWTGLASSVGAVTNDASRAEFTISSGGAVIGGVGLVGGGSSPTIKGDIVGGGVLFSASSFTGGDRTLFENDILRLTWICSATNV